MDRLAEQESRMHIKEIFAGRRDCHGGDICNYLSDGSYYFPFIIYREQIKNHNNLSMANRGFENPCEVIVKDHEGLVYLAVSYTHLDVYKRQPLPDAENYVKEMRAFYTAGWMKIMGQ